VHDFGTFHDVLVRWNRHHNHDILRMDYVADSHDDGAEVVHCVDDALSGAGHDTHCVVDGADSGVGELVEDGTDDENGGQNREKLELAGALEVRLANPMGAGDLPLLDNHGKDFLRDLEVELLAHLAEVFEGDVVAAAVDHIEALDLLTDEGDVHIAQSIDVHKILHARMPLHSSRRLPHCNSHKPNAEDARNHPVADSEHNVEMIPYQVNSGPGFE